MILCSFIHDFIQLYTILCTALIHYLILVCSILRPRYSLLSTLLFTLYSLLHYCCIYCNRPGLTPCSVQICGGDTHHVLLTIPYWSVAVTHTLFYSLFRTDLWQRHRPCFTHCSVLICDGDTYPVLLTVPYWSVAATHTLFYSLFRTDLWRWHIPCFTHCSVLTCGGDTDPVLLIVLYWPAAATHTIQLGKGPPKASVSLPRQRSGKINMDG